jgi:acyl-CoA reductase-like NAD-dependent aldehyde dehydrogenase
LTDRPQRDVIAHFSAIIDGEPLETEATMDVVNPATGEVFAQAPECNQRELDAAFASAAKAFQDWQVEPLAISASRR